MERGEHVGKRAQRKSDAILRAEGEPEPRHNNDDGQRPCCFCVMLAGPEKNDRSSRTEQARKQRADEDAAFVRKRLHKPYFCSRRYSALRLRPSVLLAWLTFPPYRLIAFWMSARSTSSRLISSIRMFASRTWRRPRSLARTSVPSDSKTARSTA